MNILMVTNTYLPHVGGVARSVSAFTEQYRKAGHRTVVVAPVFPNQPESEQDVIRVPAIQNFNGSDFSMAIPVPGFLKAHLESFKPDIVHSHHPYLLGSTAMRVASGWGCPLIFTHHTMYEQYLHYVPANAPRMKEFVINLVTGYCGLCDHVVAPSQTIAQILQMRGVKTPIQTIPTGVDVARFADGDGASIRKQYQIPADAFVVGYVGRLAAEKNLEFLARAVADFVASKDDAWFLAVGSGESDADIRAAFEEAGVANRLILSGTLEGRELIDAYHATDILAFASKSETQGMVLAEAMAASVPVVAIDASGVREVVRNRVNGRLLRTENQSTFSRALDDMYVSNDKKMAEYRKEAYATAEKFALTSCAERMLDLYHKAMDAKPDPSREDHLWERAVEQVKAEWELLKNWAEAAGGNGKEIV